jgi:FkbM family methyltransferase
MYSQNDEEAKIVEFFGTRPGRFLDVGAFDGVTFSNTHRLLELGWIGVMVEPSPVNFYALVGNTAKYAERVTLIPAAVSRIPGLHKFWMDDTPTRGWSSTMNSEMLAIGSVMKPNPASIMVPTLKLSHLSSFGPYDFISIDAEGEDLGIMEDDDSFLPVLYACRLLCVEKGQHREKMLHACKGHGFKTIFHETPENLLLTK